jgi:hypothetical protein
MECRCGKQGRYVETTADEFNAWLGKESGKPVHIATEDADLTAEEQIASFQGFRFTAYYLDFSNVGWFGLTPDGRRATTRDTGIQEIYAFDLEYN